MSSTTNNDGATLDSTLLEKVNQVFNTAKMTLYQLAEAGDADAAELSAAMGLTWEATQDSANELVREIIGQTGFANVLTIA